MSLDQAIQFENSYKSSVTPDIIEGVYFHNLCIFNGPYHSKPLAHALVLITFSDVRRHFKQSFYLNQLKRIAVALGSSIGLLQMPTAVWPHSPPNNRTNKNLKIKRGRREEKNEHSQLRGASFPSEPPVIVTEDHGKPGSLIIAQNLNPDQNKLTNNDWIKPLICQMCKAIPET